MIKEVMENTKLVIKQRLKLELILYIENSQPFLGLYKDIKIAISNLKIRHSIFVEEIEDYNLVSK